MEMPQKRCVKCNEICLSEHGCMECLIKENRRCMAIIKTNLHVIEHVYGKMVCASCHELTQDNRICGFCKVKYGLRHSDGV